MYLYDVYINLQESENYFKFFQLLYKVTKIHRYSSGWILSIKKVLYVLYRGIENHCAIFFPRKKHGFGCALFYIIPLLFLLFYC